jgi:hypothetical protein
MIVSFSSVIALLSPLLQFRCGINRDSLCRLRLRLQWVRVTRQLCLARPRHAGTGTAATSGYCSAGVPFSSSRPLTRSSIKLHCGNSVALASRLIRFKLPQLCLGQVSVSGQPVRPASACGYRRQPSAPDPSTPRPCPSAAEK